MFNQAKIEVVLPFKIAEYYTHRDLPGAGSHKQKAKEYATKAIESVFLHAITKFAEVMSTTCNKNMYCDICCRLSCFLVDACMWRWMSGKYADVFSDSRGAIVPQLMGKLVKTLILKKDKKNLEIVINEIDVHIIHRMDCWIQNGEDWLQLKQQDLDIKHYVEDTSYPMKDSDAYAICGFIHYLARVIVMGKYAAFVSEAKEAMDDVIKVIKSTGISLGDQPLSTKVEGVTKRWSEIIHSLATGTSGERYYPIIRLEAAVLYKLNEQLQKTS
jgi:hypothetical protein